MTAPLDWVWCLFPLESDGMSINTDSVVSAAMVLVDAAARTGDYAPIGRVIHWAHIFKSEQDRSGGWPVEVNARTGEAIGAARTAAPAALMARLDALLDSCEYAASIEAAAQAFPQGDSDGTRGTDQQPGIRRPQNA